MDEIEARFAAWRECEGITPLERRLKRAADLAAWAMTGKLPIAPEKPADSSTVYCSFCAKSQHEVKKIIAGPVVFICDECVKLCTDIVRESEATEASSQATEATNESR